MELENIATIGMLVFVALLIPVLDRIPRSKGKSKISHAIFVLLSISVIVFLPEEISDVVFSPDCTLIIGTMIPIYRSIVAVCTIEEEDDTEWLQYWIAYGSFSYATEFMEDISRKFPVIADHWYQFKLLLTLWMLLPFTDGSAFLYEHFTLPYLQPTCQKLQAFSDGYMQIILTLVNGSYMWIVWMTFVTLPEEARRFVVVAVGTIYPMAASVMAVTTSDGGVDDAYWLTYWSCFNILFILMDYLENFVGSIFGFYSICLACTIYLFLPMFRGAEAIFRKVLVPLSGQYESMLLRDAYLVRKQMESNIPDEFRKEVFAKAAKVFTDEPTTGPIDDTKKDN